jgi:hypothetical protein
VNCVSFVAIGIHLKVSQEHPRLAAWQLPLDNFARGLDSESFTPYNIFAIASQLSLSHIMDEDMDFDSGVGVVPQPPPINQPFNTTSANGVEEGRKML